MNSTPGSEVMTAPSASEIRSLAGQPDPDDAGRQALAPGHCATSVTRRSRGGGTGRPWTMAMAEALSNTVYPVVELM